MFSELSCDEQSGPRGIVTAPFWQATDLLFENLKTLLKSCTAMKMSGVINSALSVAHLISDFSDPEKSLH